MNMDFNLSLTQEQKLIMTQQMQLSIKILQMSTYELQEHINKEVQENPVLDMNNVDLGDKQNEFKKLDYKEIVKYLEFDNYSGKSYWNNNEDDEVSPFYFISEKKSLKQYLKEQIIELNCESWIKNICMYMIENIDERGYLAIGLEDICRELNISLKKAEIALNVVQSLEPVGICARDIKECLKIQVMKKNMHNLENSVLANDINSVNDIFAKDINSINNIFAIIDKYLECLAENKYSVIAKGLNINIKTAQEYGDIIKSLQPKPASGFYTGEETKFIIPDAYIIKVGEEYQVLVNDGVLPKLNINNVYREIINNSEDAFTLDYVKEKISGAMSLIKSIDQRKNTIHRVLSEIIKLQKDYFEKGEKYLKPMTLKDIAYNLELHESTVSRAIRDKYVCINKGKILEIKELFTTGMHSYNVGEDISTNSIKQEIKEIIENENKLKPLSDQNICEILNKDGMNISRRTVAKYREELGIKSSSKRKRF